ncbi:D-Ala-D-Ala carboxypeptidase family metallohydrolase [Alistipes sp. ZOR0009]|uniref:D-Ala-D-Ala carboxypeptidase family metallohydrolase n=1 Tax=Alistipes sp. ZOR0009 TaxID=1339253 RepID=UPI0006459A2C|nr:D-Ala-D-Ala carboxypeptidase family metallohydrolase [Alistipes sp. ZOR0009]
MNLSKNLTLEEVTKSSTAEKLKIRNDNMTEEVLANLKALAEAIFQAARDKLGPIRISSGYRSPELNKAVGGSQTSQHSKGEALDLQGISVSNKELFMFIKDHLDFDQLIWEFGTNTNPEWVHVSYRRSGKNRKQVLISVKENGKTGYKNWPA